MSRIGRKPIQVPSGVEVKIDGHHITVKGPKGTLEHDFHKDMTVPVENGVIEVTRPSDDKAHRSLHGLTRSLVNNMVLYPSADVPHRMIDWALFFGLPVVSIIAFCLLCAIAGPSFHERRFTLRYVKYTLSYFWFGLTWIPILFRAAFLAKDQGKWVKTEHTRGISLDEVKK